jgi:hypothetical protein
MVGLAGEVQDLLVGQHIGAALGFEVGTFFVSPPRCRHRSS